ncbi:unnamed protein product [Effrenium voratum]|nr:unnamed protein product [Effrenium voratum]CAJ1443995.1 unnamed protein product [Effrenium voratum]
MSLLQRLAHPSSTFRLVGLQGTLRFRACQPDRHQPDRQRCLELFGTCLSKGELRSKFLELAKTLHPDANAAGATTAAFQELQSCYALLMSEHGPREEPEWLRKLREDYANSKDPFP